ncbi:YkvA family protein [Megasphaera sp.]|uniref:YkvA family protein n=1 Tax=Megasphaera sp. TaxID=2023260 RepID=UPI00351F8EF7
MWKVLRFFARFYTPGKFVTFVRKTGRKVHFLPKLLTIFYCMQDEDTPKFIKLALMGALGYVILPFDFVPDVFAGFGWLDDAVVAAALRLAGTYVKPEHREKVRHMFPFFRVRV